MSIFSHVASAISNLFHSESTSVSFEVSSVLLPAVFRVPQAFLNMVSVERVSVASLVGYQWRYQFVTREKLEECKWSREERDGMQLVPHAGLPEKVHKIKVLVFQIPF